MSRFKEASEELAVSLDGLRSLALKRGSDTLARRTGALKEKLESDNFHIVVMGQFKRGKTTFVNSLLGAEVLPVSVVPLTSINTVLRYGDQVVAEVHYLDGGIEKVGVEDIPGFVTEKGNPENRLGVKRVEVFHPSPYLRDGVCLVDTPGTGSIFLHNDEMALSYLSHSDAVIFMLSSDPPVSVTELNFLHEIRGFVKKIFFVQNKIDYLDPREMEESLSFNSQAISEALDEESIDISPVSAKQALIAQMTGDEDTLTSSRLPAFISRLEEFLMKEKGAILLSSILKNLDKAVSEEMAGVELEISLLAQPAKELEDKVGRFREEMVLVRRERQEILFLINGDFKSFVKDILDVHVEEFKKNMTGPVLESYDIFFKENEDLSGSAFVDALSDYVKQLIRESFTEWRLEEEEVLSGEFKIIERRYREKANSTANRILKIAGDLFEITPFTIEAEFDLSSEGEFWFKLGDPPSDLEMFTGFLSKALPKKISRRVLKKRKEEELLRLFDRHCGRVRYDFYLRLQQSVNALRSRVDDVIGETLETIEEGIGRAVSLRESGAESVESSIDGLRQYRSELERFSNELGIINSALQGVEDGG